ncbi:hypothetical protein [Mycolicibacter icosiumassiliensis]|uniref:hypothetical protein n=1 Tax=Mycolicibacter icosiumassiliensis TaxID=1792835 RepID=UPI000837458D|nr:hypothetical protein [Mycolicibacter icosiumassiliensis]
MTNATLNRALAPFAAATLATAAVVAPIAATVEPTLPTFSTSNFDIELTAGGSLFNPNVPLFNPESLGSTALTPLPQILLNGLQNPLGFLPTLETLAPYLMALPAVPGALAIAGPDYLLHSLAADNPDLAGIASGYDQFAQTVASGLGGLPLIGEPIETAFRALPVLTQLLTSSVINPFPTLFDTSDFWQGLVSGGGIGDLIGGAEASSAAGTEFLGVDLSGVQALIEGLPNINDILGFSISDMLGPLGVLAAPLDLIGLGLMIPLALPLVAADLLFGGGIGDLFGGSGLSDLFGGFGDLFGGGIGDLLGGAEATAFAEPNYLLSSLASDFVANPAASTEFMGIDLSGVQDFLTGLPNINDILGFSLSDALGPLGVLLAPLDVIGLGLMIPLALPLVGADLLFGGGLDGIGDLFGGGLDGIFSGFADLFSF